MAKIERVIRIEKEVKELCQEVQGLSQEAQDRMTKVKELEKESWDLYHTLPEELEEDVLREALRMYRDICNINQRSLDIPQE